ncbi:MAG: methylated-DNA--[protein]-cysteine S-methyltransferase [Ignavibacteria bacterium]|nr:methylated-DNA--[protein]-cysteine S-methyltransferase [Ignavibacteria bacterium]
MNRVTKELIYRPPFGVLKLQSDGKSLTSVKFITGRAGLSKSGCKILNQAKKQLNEYFSGKRKKFSLPLNPAGTEFQKKVWKELCKIKYGHLVTYKDIANSLGNLKTVRAVGNAVAKNPVPIIIPCHRVIHSSGDVTGYSGPKAVKEWLIYFESLNIKQR